MKRYIAAWVVLALATSSHAADFATGKHVELASVELLESTSCDDDGVLDTGETARVRVTLSNSGTERLERTSMTLSSTDPDLSFPEGQTASFPASDPLQSVSAEVKVKLAGAATPRKLALTIAYRDEAQTTPGDKTRTVEYRVNTDDVPGTSTRETVDASRPPWTPTANPTGLQPWAPESSGESRFFRGPANPKPGSLWLVSPPLQVSGTAEFRVIFQQRYVFEVNASGIAYDGGIIELSADDGQSWVNVGASLSPTYNLTLHTLGSNPLRGKQAYGGQSAGYPAFTKATLSLGTTYAGKTVRLRFHIGTDDSNDSTGWTGWEVDDVQLEGVVNSPFSTVVAHRGLCVNRTPVANAGPGQTVNERRLVTLAGSGTDPEGATLTYEWTQTQGPTVALSDPKVSNPTFIAPEVTQDTDLQFELRVRDGVNTSVPSVVKVRVLDVSAGNRAPVVQSTPVLSVNERDKVTLAATGTDADGDALSYEWTQVGGTSTVVLEGAKTAQATFTAPGVTETIELTFQVVASDSLDRSTPFTVIVRVNDFNHAPVAQVKPVGPVDEATKVTLEGSATDVDEDPLVYTWTQVSGPTVTLSDTASATPGFTAPLVESDTELTFQLVVGDGKVESAPVTVTVLVRNVPNKPPVAHGGGDQKVTEGSGVTLNGSGSKDPEGAELKYTWTQVDGPTVTLMPAGPRATFNAPEVDGEAALTFQLEVEDNQGERSTATVTVRVIDKVAPPKDSGCGCAAGRDGGVPTTALLLLAALGFMLRRRRTPLVSDASSSLQPRCCSATR